MKTPERSFAISDDVSSREDEDRKDLEDEKDPQQSRAPSLASPRGNSPPVASSQPLAISPPPPPNGGYGWVCTVCVALINAHTWGLMSSYGVFLGHYLEHSVFPGATHLEYAFVGGLSFAMAMLVAPIATITTRILGTHMTLSIGIALEVAGLISASFTNAIWQLFLSQGLCFGLGIGFLFVGSVGIPSQWFTTRRSLANGIAACGSGLGGLTYSLAAGAMIKTIGMPWAFRVLGILCFFVNATCTCFLRDRNKIIGSSQSIFAIGILRRPEYILLGAWGFFSMLGYIVLIFSLANYANSVGLNSSQAALISALFNLGQGLGRPPVGYFSDTVGRLNMAAAMTFLAGVFSLVLWMFARMEGVLIFFALVGGAVGGTFWTTITPLAAEVTGLRNVPSSLNLMWLIIVLPTFFSEPIAVEMLMGTHHYRPVILFTGFMYVAASLCLLLLRGWKVGEVEYLKSIHGSDASEEGLVGKDENPDAKAAGRKTFLKYCMKWQKV